MWRWENSESFDRRLQELQDNEIEIPVTWVDCFRNPVKIKQDRAATKKHIKLSQVKPFPMAMYYQGQEIPWI